MRPFGCHVTILNTLDHLGKFDGKSDDGFFVGYSLTSKAFKVYNIRTRKVEENLHIRFLENKTIVTGDGPKWLFDIDSLTKSMNYVLVVAGTKSNDFAGLEESNGAGHTSKETEFSQDYIVMPLWKDGSMFDSSSKNSNDREPQPYSNVEKKDDEGVSKASGFSDQEQLESSTSNTNTAWPSINTDSANFKTSSLNINTVSPTVITTRYLKGQPKLGLWYPKDSPFDLEAYTDSDYAGASLDRKSTIGGCQFLGSRLISWQCKKQTVVANSTTKAEYVAAASCCGKTKHIEIRHHFIRDSNEKKLIQMIKIHTDQNVADLLTKAFDVDRF
ncbi:hypothetical protein Tco_0757708 [Tanacetum coccineum]